MGFLPDDDDVYHLTFEDPQYKGLEVTMTGLTVGEMLDDMALDFLPDQLADVERDIAGNLPLIKRMNDATMRTFTVFADHLIDWNVERKVDGKRVRVPATLDGVKTQKLTFIRTIVKTWRTAVNEVPGPLDPPSNGGATYPELSIPMEISSPNQPS